MKATRDGFGDELYELIKQNPNLVVLTADLGESVRLGPIKRDFPAQFVEVGISEQNLIGVAAGMALTGKTVFATSFATFNPGRNWEQIRVSVAEQGVDVKIVGSHAGLATGADGATHQALEDIALTTVLSGMTVVAPADYQEAREATRALATTPGPAYLRLSRAPTGEIDFGQTPFRLGRLRLVRTGSDAVILTYGLTLPLAVAVADELRAQAELEIAVADVATLQPLDDTAILELAALTGAVITLEEHQLTGGLGSLVASLLSRHEPCPLEMVAIAGRFGQSGTPAQLWAEYGLTPDNLRAHVLAALERKRDSLAIT